MSRVPVTPSVGIPFLGPLHAVGTGAVVIDGADPFDRLAHRVERGAVSVRAPSEVATIPSGLDACQEVRRSRRGNAARVGILEVASDLGVIGPDPVARSYDVETARQGRLV